MKREDSVSSVVLSTALVSLTLTKHYWVQYSKIFSWARARRGSGRVNGDSALKQPAAACCTSKKRRNATASSNSTRFTTKRAPRTRLAKRNKSKLAQAGTLEALRQTFSPLYTGLFFFFGIFNAVLKSYTKLLFMQVVACSRDLCQGMRRISKIGVIFILELLAPKDITGQTLKIMPKICNEQAW